MFALAGIVEEGVRRDTILSSMLSAGGFSSADSGRAGSWDDTTGWVQLLIRSELISKVIIIFTVCIVALLGEFFIIGAFLLQGGFLIIERLSMHSVEMSDINASNQQGEHQGADCACSGGYPAKTWH